MARQHASRGQVLVLFTMFLLVLLGISALAIDYASWLLTDRTLQNYSDHASLAGASAFADRTAQGACDAGLGVAECNTARAQAWASLNNELNLGLTPTIIACLSNSTGGDDANSPDTGETDSSRANAGACTSEAPIEFGHRIWVSTPPPVEEHYEDWGGRYALNYGVVWVRVDRDVRSFLGGALGIVPDPRTGWATAGSLPTDFALETFCRNHIPPQNGVCESSSGVALDGAGVVVHLERGDIGSNESLFISSPNGRGVIVESGNVFLVNGNCEPGGVGKWSCPQVPATTGGIADDDPTLGTANGKNAFYMAPLPVPQFHSPLGNALTPLVDTTTTHRDCDGASSTSLCVPFRPYSGSISSPGDWSCSSTAIVDPCGDPDFTGGQLTCIGRGGGNPGNHYYPIAPISNADGANNIQGDAAHPPTNTEWVNIDDDFEAGDLDTTSTPANPPVDFLFTPDIDIGGGPGFKTVTTFFRVNLDPAGPRLAGISTVRYVAYKTLGGVPDNTGYDVTLEVKLLQGATTIAVDPTLRTLNDVPTRFEFQVGAGVITDFNSLKLQFTFSEFGERNTTNERGGAVSWAGIEHPDPQPASPPMIPPGYYHSITIDDDGCAVLDPTGEYDTAADGLKTFQMPGIYRFQGDGSAKIELGDGSALIGDGVTLVFDSGFPAPAGNKGIVVGDDSVLALNTARVPGVPQCTPSETETITYNPSTGLSGLPTSAVCAAWGVDTSSSQVFKPGLSNWPVCATSGRSCVTRAEYDPSSGYRGITFYFSPPDWTPANNTIEKRFQQSGGGTPSIAFRGVLYAPYDDVKMAGGCNGFDTVGQVLSWTVKFNGGCGYIRLDYPYDFTPAKPYLLEPTIDH